MTLFLRTACVPISFSTYKTKYLLNITYDTLFENCLCPHFILHIQDYGSVSKNTNSVKTFSIYLLLSISFSRSLAAG